MDETVVNIPLPNQNNHGKTIVDTEHPNQEMSTHTRTRQFNGSSPIMIYIHRIEYIIQHQNCGTHNMTKNEIPSELFVLSRT